jgi:hypothetical protein
MLNNFINPSVFIISFGIAIIIVYLIHPEPTIIYKYPNPENAGKITYQDKDENCYKYEANEVKCPSDPNLIIEHPLIIK